MKQVALLIGLTFLVAFAQVKKISSFFNYFNLSQNSKPLRGPTQLFAIMHDIYTRQYI
jgi:hypothetical protein